MFTIVVERDLSNKSKSCRSFIGFLEAAQLMKILSNLSDYYLIKDRKREHKLYVENPRSGRKNRNKVYFYYCFIIEKSTSIFHVYRHLQDFT